MIYGWVYAVAKIEGRGNDDFAFVNKKPFSHTSLGKLDAHSYAKALSKETGLRYVRDPSREEIALGERVYTVLIYPWGH